MKKRGGGGGGGGVSADGDGCDRDEGGHRHGRSSRVKYASG